MKMNSKNLYLFLLAMVFMAMAQAQSQRQQPAGSRTTLRSGSQAPAQAQTQPSSGTRIPGLDVIGYGYDIFGSYASQNSLKPHRLFDFTNFKDEWIDNTNYSVPRGVILRNISKHEVNTVSGESVREYAKSLSASVGLEFEAVVFSGSVNTTVGSSSEGSSTRLFHTYMDINTKWRINLDDEVKRSILTPEFKNHIDNMEPSALFARYGTHYVDWAYLGGRIDYITTATISSNTQRQNIETALEAKYKAVTGTGSFNQSQENTLKNSNTSTRFVVTGGNSQFTTNLDDKDTYMKWAEGIESRPVLCGFGKESLKPIWEFASTPQRKQLLEAEFNKLLQRYPLPVEMADVGSMSKHYYLVRSRSNEDLYLDLKGFNLLAEQAGGRITLFEKDRRGSNRDLEGADRFMKLIFRDGHMYVQPQHSGFVFQAVGNTAGSEVQLADLRFTANQRFKLIKAGARDTYFIVGVNDLNLTANGKNAVTLEAKTDAANQQWVFEMIDPFKFMAPPNTGVKFSIENVLGKRHIDMPGRGSGAVKKTAKLQLWDMDNDVDRYFTIAEAAPAFVIESAHNKNLVMDNEQGRSPRNGSLIHMWDRHNGPSQLFTFEWAGNPGQYRIKSNFGNKYINASRSNVARNGCHIQLWDKGNEDNEVWIFHVVK